MQATHVFADPIVVVAEINLIELSAEQLTLESQRWKQLQLSLKCWERFRFGFVY